MLISLPRKLEFRFIFALRYNVVMLLNLARWLRAPYPGARIVS